MREENQTSRVVISGTGLFTPPYSISNQELVDSFNAYIDSSGKGPNADGTLSYSSVDFIEKASGIRSRFVMNKEGILAIDRMCPNDLERGPDEPSVQCEMGVAAARQALNRAKKTPKDIGTVLVACSNVPRPYPALAIEIQQALEIEGFAYDLNVACASAVFGIHAAYNQVRQQPNKAVLVISPEICSGHLDFRDRDSHFIFGDACTAVLVESRDTCQSEDAFSVLSAKMQTQFSTNIRNNFGFLNRTDPNYFSSSEKLFKQNGRKVFKEVVTLASKHILDHLASCELTAESLKRMWLHQANLNLNQMIGKIIFGKEMDPKMAPVILDRYANTSSAGSIIAFHLHHDDLKSGDYAMLSAFGAGYSVGSLLLQKI